MNARVIQWTFIGLAIGVCLYFVGKPMSPSNRLSGISKFDALLNEGKPVYGVSALEKTRPNFLRSRPRQAPQPEPAEEVALTPPAPEQIEKPITTEVKPSPTPKVLGKADVEKAKKEEEEKKKKALARKKKIERMKKIKEARERRFQMQLEQEERIRAEFEAEKRRRESSREIENVALMAPIPTPAPTPLPGKGAPGEAVPQTVSEWEERLLKEPNANRTAQFVRYFLSGKIKGDVFYSIMKKMIEDDRPRMRELAVKSVAEIYNIGSFTLLVHAVQTETDVEIKNRIEEALQSYASPTNVRHLAEALSEEMDPQVSYIAMDLLRQSIETNLRGPSSGYPNDTDPRVPAVASLTRIYTSFVPTLAELSQRSADPQLRQSAAMILNELQFLLAAM